jgi:sugar phosphate isomerase/epimerase
VPSRDDADVKDSDMLFTDFSPARVGIHGWTYDEMIPLVVEAGFKGLDIDINQIPTVDDAAALADRYASAGLRAGIAECPFTWNDPDVPEDWTRGLGRLEEWCKRIRAAGGTCAYDHVFPGSNTMEWDEYFTFLVERLKPMCAIFADHGLTFGLEYIGPETRRAAFKYPFIHRLDQMLELVQTVGDGCGIAVDVFHHWCGGSAVEDIARLGETKVVCVHLNDARAGVARADQLDPERAMPMESGLVDSPGILRELAALGCDAPVFVEPFRPHTERLGAAGAAVAAPEAMGWLAKAFDAAGLER